MKLKNKILLGFSSVLGIVLILCVVLGLSLSNISRISRGVGGVDGGLIDMLVTQGRILRFALYKDPAFVPQARESLERSAKAFGVAHEMFLLPENRALIEAQTATLKNVDINLNEMVKLEDRRLEIETALRPLTQKLDTLLMGLRTHVGTEVAGDASATLGRYNLIIDSYNALMKARLAARVYTMDSTPENEQAAMNALSVVQQLIGQMSGMSLDSKGLALVKDIDTVFRAYGQMFQNLVTVSGQILQANVVVRDMFVDVLSDGLKLAEAASATLLDEGAQSTLALYVGAVVVFLILLGIAIMLTRNVQAQLGMDPGELSVMAERVTKGDFDIDNGSPRIGVYGNLIRMVAALKENINNAHQESEKAHQESARAQMAMQSAEEASLEAQKKTRTMLEAADRLDEVAQTVSSASAQLSSQIEHSEQGASEQAARVTETATAMEEMNASVLEVAKNAGQAADVSTSTREKAVQGASVVERAVKSIQFVQQQSLSLKQDMEQLGANAQSIDQIMGVISDIADQTNLLALNAAIEAARAGDAGRGFAVVADEVRKLAEKTMASTTDVGNAIRAIQQSAIKSMEQVDAAVTTIEEATKLANESGVVLQEIVTLVDHTADQVRAIATASEQQSASSDEINQSMNKVNNIAGETAQAMGEAAQAVGDLARQAHILTQLIEDMKRG